MGEPLANPRFSRNFASWIAIAGFGCIAVVGCSSIRSGTSNATVPGGERAQIATTVPKKPGGLHAPLRVSKFAFYANIPLDADDPVFRDLEELPDQIQRELRLPASNTIVQVYLFEDQDKYEAFMRDRFPWLPSRRAYFITDQKRPGTLGALKGQLTAREMNPTGGRGLMGGGNQSDSAVKKVTFEANPGEAVMHYAIRYYKSKNN